MTEPVRILEGGGSQFQQNLLLSAHREQPSQELTLQMHSAIFAAATSPPTDAPPPDSSTNPARLRFTTTSTATAKLAALVLSVSGLSWVAWLWTSSFTSPIPRSANQGQTVSALHARPLVTPNNSTTRPSSLREEVRLLDAVRAALSQNHVAIARRLLDEYQSQFPSGTLRQEGESLRESMK